MGEASDPTFTTLGFCVEPFLNESDPSGASSKVPFFSKPTMVSPSELGTFDTLHAFNPFEGVKPTIVKSSA